MGLLLCFFNFIPLKQLSDLMRAFLTMRLPMTVKVGNSKTFFMSLKSSTHSARLVLNPSVRLDICMSLFSSFGVRRIGLLSLFYIIDPEVVYIKMARIMSLNDLGWHDDDIVPVDLMWPWAPFLSSGLNTHLISDTKAKDNPRKSGTQKKPYKQEWISTKIRVFMHTVH